MPGLPRMRVALLAALLLPALALGQPAPPAPPDPLGGSPDPVVLPSNRKASNQIKAAHEYITAQDWDNAVRLLQRVLDEPEDSLLESEGKDAQGNVTVLRSSARAEAERLLAGLPKQGLATYRVKVGGLALVALAKARANPRLLDDVVRRYFLTDAGAEALAAAAFAELDRGHDEEAADRFRRLLRRPDLDELPPLTLFQAALAFHAAGDPAREDQAVQTLGRRLGPGGLTVGGQALSLDDVRKEVGRWPAGVALSSDWPLFRGDRRRTGRADADVPLLEARSRAALPAYDEVTKLLAPQALPGQPSAPAPAGLPGFVPIAVGGRLVYRGRDGLHGLDAETGAEIWHSDSPMSLDSVLSDDQRKWQFRRWLGMYRGQPSLPDENALLGTLSSDGRHVFAVEDLPVPPHPQDLTDMQQGVKHWFSTAEENLYHNRLRAVDARTGAYRWEVGAWQRPGDAPPPGPAEYVDAFFLGAPLPVGRRLFALTERRQELNLLCIDADSGALIWSQNLAATGEDLKYDPARRMQPIHLAYADGVLLCPTNVGALVAVDPLSHNLLWAHLYRERKETQADGAMPTFAADEYESEWRGCAPLVHGDRVVFTAPDDKSIRCLNLRDGSLVWARRSLDEDLYVAGVFEDKAAGGKVLVVGRNGCRAYGLARGEEVWEHPVVVGPPAGMGAATGNFYYLPLQSGDIFRIDLTNPGASTRIEGRPDEPAGNLVFHGDDLWSQSPRAVAAYPQVGKGLERAEARLAKNPRDATARMDRGRLLYSKGESARAVEDWLVALDNDPPTAMVAPTRDRLFRVLAQMLRQNFTANEKYLDDYQKLCQRPAPPGLTAEGLHAYQAQQRRRLLDLLAISAVGREEQGQVGLALKAYRRLYDAALANEMMTVPEDPSVRIRPDLWVQGRIAELARKATDPARRKAIQEEIERDAKAASASDGDEPLARLVGLFGTMAGPLGASAREARLTLAERWIEAPDRGRAADAELHLHYMRRLTDAPEVAARAQYDYARLLTRHGLLAEALEAYSALARDFPAVAVHDGKTGAALLDDLAADKRFLTYLDDPLAARPAGRVKFVELPPNGQAVAPDLACDPQDGIPQAPCCRNLRLSLDPQTFALKVASKDGSAPPWSATLPVPTSYLQQCSAAGYSFTYQGSDHFLVLSLGPVVVGVDRLERRARWVRSLLPADMPPNTQATPGGADGSVFIPLENRPGQTRRLGLLGPVGPNGAFVQTKDGVAALDPATGGLRWLRTDPAPLLDGFGDEEHLYLVELHAAGDVRAVRAVRTADGAAVPIPDAVAVYGHKLRTLGRCVLASEPGAQEEVRLRLYDVQTGQDVWKKTFPPRSVVLESALPELTAVASPDGIVTVVDLAARKELIRLALDDLRHLDKVTRGMLLRDRTQYYLAFQSSDTAPGVVGDPGPNINGPIKWTEVSGMIYAFDRATGARNWYTRALSQTLLLDHFEESPVLLLTAMQQRQTAGAPGGATVQVVSTRSIDKQTGSIRYRKELPNPSNPFYAVEIDVRTGTIDLIGAAMKLRHYLDAGKSK